MQRRRRSFRPRIRVGPCFFCKSGSTPDYKETELLKKYITDRGKIVAKTRSGLCQKHQRKLATAIKRSRHLAMISFVAGR